MDFPKIQSDLSPNVITTNIVKYSYRITFLYVANCPGGYTCYCTVLENKVVFKYFIKHVIASGSSEIFKLKYLSWNLKQLKPW